MSEMIDFVKFATAMRARIFIYFSIVFVMHVNTCYANKTDSVKIDYQVYLEPYYFPYSNTIGKLSEGFLFNYTEKKGVSINLAMAMLQAKGERSRASFGLMAGTYSRDNLFSEADWAKPIFEASAGIKLSKNQNFWLDAGVFQSHIGYEWAIGFDCMMLSRSMAAENSPYYESGFKLSHISLSGKTEFEILLLNGWQRISPLNNKVRPATGHRFTWKPNNKMSLTSSSFAGDGSTNEDAYLRFFHHFNMQYQLNERWKLIASFDYGTQQKKPKSIKYSSWWNNTLCLEYAFSNQIKLKCRQEFFNDPSRVIISDLLSEKVFLNSISLGIDYQFDKASMLRFEWRRFGKTNRAFNQLFNESNRTNTLLLSLAVKLKSD
jgi:hypothetical protein